MSGPAADALGDWFAELYGGPPEGVWCAPGRVNLIGEHTDYNQGFVLPFALGAGVSVAAGRRGDGLIALSSRDARGAGVTVRLAELAPGSIGGWAAYPVGVVWALAAAGYRVGGVSIAVSADLAPGAGLSSSAALECATALALDELHQLAIPRRELAALARRAENDFVGVPTGIMDQSAALLCRAGHALLLDCRSGEGTAVPLDPAAAGLAFMLIDTRARHALTDGRYADRRRACEDAARALGVSSLREVTDDAAALAALADSELRHRARHVLTENRRVLEVARLLGAGQLARVGPVLTASHASLRDDFEVSWPEADAAVDTALAAGALGARMMGGGFGGSVIALVPGEYAAAITAALAGDFAARRWAEPRFLAAVPSQSAHRLR